MFDLLWHELNIRRGAMLGWGIGIGFFSIVYVGIYPSLAEQMAAFQEILDLPFYQAFGMSDMTSFEGYVAGTLINFLPLIIGIYALMTGTQALAGEEDRGTLENLVVLPLARWQLVVAKAAAMILAALMILAIAALITLGVLGYVKSQVDVATSYADMAWAILSAWPITAFLMMISLFLSAFLPNRGAAGMVATVILVGSYLGNNLFDLLESLADYRWVFPFYYFDKSPGLFENGPQTSDLAVLFSAALVFLFLAVISFNHRNLMTGAWFWQRPRPPAPDKN
jgi:ABC-2 type transport system permease protein